MPYSYTIEHVPGHKLPSADALSCLPDPSGVAPNNQADEELLVITQVIGPGNLTMDHVRTASRDNPELVSSTIPCALDFRQDSRNVRTFLNHSIPFSMNSRARDLVI